MVHVVNCNNINMKKLFVVLCFEKKKLFKSNRKINRSIIWSVFSNKTITTNNYEYDVCGIKPQIECIVQFDLKNRLANLFTLLFCKLILILVNITLYKSNLTMTVNRSIKWPMLSIVTIETNRYQYVNCGNMLQNRHLRLKNPNS